MADKKKEEKEGGSKISNTEWWMVISLLGIIDIIQFVLNWIGIPFIATVGTIANRLIDVVVGLAWTTYLHLRGVDIKSTKMVGSIALTFFLEEIPDVDSLPLWFADGIFIMLTVKAEELLKKETGIDAEKVASASEGGTEAVSGDNESSEGEAGAETETGNEGGPSDEYADAMGQESNKRDENSQSETPESSHEEGDEGDQDHDISDEDADELGQESDNKSEEGETPEDKKKKNTPAQNGGTGGGGGARGSRSDDSPNRLDLRKNPIDQKEEEEKNRLERHSNLLDLFNSYKGGNK